jgi:hypothetical protein
MCCSFLELIQLHNLHEIYISAMDLVPDPEFFNWTDPDPN